MEMKTGTRLRYRPFKESDTPAILDLWENHSGWGKVSESQFREWNFNNPYEPNLLVIAEHEDGSVIGQMTFIPARLWISGEEIPAVRIVAPILHREFRYPDLRNLEHPALAMLKTGFMEASARGYGVGYAFPALGWLAVAKLLPMLTPHATGTASFGCIRIPLHDARAEKIPANDLKGQIVSVFTSEYDLLWEDAKSNLPLRCAIVRKQKWLQWKFGNHLVFEFRDSHNCLRGYCAIRKNSGLVEDLFAASQREMGYVLQETIKMLGEEKTDRPHIEFPSLKMMLTAPVEKLLSGLYHEPEDYRFAFVYVALQHRYDEKILDPAGWYMMPND